MYVLYWLLLLLPLVGKFHQLLISEGERGNKWENFFFLLSSSFELLVFIKRQKLLLKKCWGTFIFFFFSKKSCLLANLLIHGQMKSHSNLSHLSSFFFAMDGQCQFQIEDLWPSTDYQTHNISEIRYTCLLVRNFFSFPTSLNLTYSPLLHMHNANLAQGYCFEHLVKIEFIAIVKVC